MKSIFISLIFFTFYSENVFSIESFDLKKAIIYASTHSPEFDTLKRQQNISELEQRSAKARMLPSLDLSAIHGIQDTSPRTKTGPWGSQFNLGLTESLYDNGITRTNIQIATLVNNQANINYKDQKNNLNLAIVTQFLIHSLNVKLFEIQEKQFKFVNIQFGLISKDYHQGIKTKNDFLRFKTQVNRSEIDLINAKNTIEKSKQELQRLIGIDFQSSQIVDFSPLSLESVNFEINYNSINLENHLQLQSAQIQKEINQLNFELVARKNLPEVTISSGVNYGSSNYLRTGQSVSDNAQVGWNALLTVKYNFFDWGIRERDKAVALQKKLIQNNELDTKLLLLKSTINQLKINILKIQKNYQLSKELLSMEKNNIDFIEREYRNGKIQYLDLVTGLNNYSDAQIKFYTAASDLEIARYTMLFHQGKLDEELSK